MLIIDIAIGLVLGITTTLLTLFLFHKIISPRVSFSEDIRVYWLETRNRPSYSIKIEKHGIVDLIDTRIHCTLYIKDILKKNGPLWNSYSIPTSFSESLIVKNGIRIVHLRLHLAKISEYKKFLYFEKFLHVGMPDTGVRFEDFFMSYANVYLRITILGHDRATGIKKLYQSKKYEFFSLQNGHWDEMELVNDR